MIPFQYAGIFVCLTFTWWNFRRLRHRHRPGWLSLLGMLVGIAGAVAIWDPEMTTRIARLVGIARGADLLTYLVALAFLGSWFYFYQRTRSLSIAVTTLVRELALRNPRPPSPREAADVGGEESRPAQPDDRS